MVVLERAVLTCRAWGWSGDIPSEHLADLMDAVHNIPLLTPNWAEWCPNFVREPLMTYQRKWADRGGLMLCDVFDEIVSGAKGGSH